MLKSLHLQNFKCYLDTEIGLENLTVFSGVNGAGKSTAIQALLFLRQMKNMKHRLGKTVCLNGGLVHFGSVYDVLSAWTNSEKPEFRIQVTSDSGKAASVCLERNDEEESMNVMTLKEHNIEQMNLFDDGFAYLSAERIGPRICFEVQSEDDALNKYGKYGEYTVGYIAQTKKLPNLRLLEKLDDPETNDFLYQLNTCFGKLGKQVQIGTALHTDVDRASLNFSFAGKAGWGKGHRPINVGFGLTYTLPVYVALLLAKPDDLLIIENPEAHLHPKGQVAIGEFLSLVAASGVQIVLETHSDHLLNGIRMAVKKGIVRNSDVQLNFVVNNDSMEGANVVTPEIDSNGRINVWPEGFFDEYDNALAELL